MKNRDDIYLVVRIDPTGSHVCAAHRLLDSAEANAGAYNQMWKDRGWDWGKFEVQIATYYDE